MARNFGVPRNTYCAYRPSMWPLVALMLIMIGLIASPRTFITRDWG